VTSIAVWLLPAILTAYVWLPKPPQAPVTAEVVQSTVEVQVEAPKAPQTVEEMLVAIWGNDQAKALKVAKCESSLNPKAASKTSTARGLFQITKETWEANTNESFDKAFDPSINIAVAKHIYDKRGWTPWKASYQCHKVR